MEGYFLYHGDKTTCGGRILSGASDDTYMGKQRVRESDPVSCGKHEGRFRVCGGMGDTYNVDGVLRQWAGSIESFSSCPCRARFVPSMWTDAYDYNCNSGLVAEREQRAVQQQSTDTGEKIARNMIRFACADDDEKLFANVPYILIFSDGREETGTTDAQGKTGWHYADEAENITLHILMD